MSWSLKLQTAPEDVLDTTTPGLVVARKLRGALGKGMELDLGDMIPRVQAPQQPLVKVPLMDGNARTFRRGPDRVRVSVKVDEWTPSDWEQFRRMVGSGKLFTFTPGYSIADFWASSFAGIDAGGGMAEVGDSQAGSYVGRVADEVHMSEATQLEGLVKATGTAAPKLVRGMIGRAIMLERKNEQLVTGQAWSAQSGAVAHVAGDSNHPDTDGKSIYIPGGGGYVENTGVGTATASQEYVAFIDIKGGGVAILQAVHNTGGTVVSGSSVSLGGGWERLSVAWTQVGTAIELRVASTGAGCIAHLGNVNVQRGKTVDNYRSHMPDTTALTSAADQLQVIASDHLPGAEGMTILAWLLMPQDNREDVGYLFSYAQTGGKSGGAYISAVNDLNASIGLASNTHTVALAATPGDWVQVAIVFKSAAGGASIQFYEDGAALGSADLVVPDHVPRGSSWHIGSDEALAAPSGFGLDTPLDNFRIISKALTAAEVLNDYDLRTQLGVRAFLTWTQGRYFEVTGGPPGFRGPFTDSIVGDLELTQVAHVAGGVL